MHNMIRHNVICSLRKFLDVSANLTICFLNNVIAFHVALSDLKMFAIGVFNICMSVTSSNGRCPVACIVQ